MTVYFSGPAFGYERASNYDKKPYLHNLGSSEEEADKQADRARVISNLMKVFGAVPVIGSGLALYKFVVLASASTKTVPHRAAHIARTVAEFFGLGALFILPDIALTFLADDRVATLADDKVATADKDILYSRAIEFMDIMIDSIQQMNSSERRKIFTTPGKEENVEQIYWELCQPIPRSVGEMIEDQDEIEIVLNEGDEEDQDEIEKYQPSDYEDALKKLLREHFSVKGEAAELLMGVYEKVLTGESFERAFDGVLDHKDITDHQQKIISKLIELAIVLGKA